MSSAHISYRLQQTSARRSPTPILSGTLQLGEDHHHTFILIQCWWRFAAGDQISESHPDTAAF